MINKLLHKLLYASQTLYLKLNRGNLHIYYKVGHTSYIVALKFIPQGVSSSYPDGALVTGIHHYIHPIILLL